MAGDLAIYSPGRGGLAGFITAYLLVPGFSLMVQHRLASRFYSAGRLGRLVGLVIWRWSVRQSACHISPLARIGPGLFLPHSTGVVIGENAVLGKSVTIYQNVTIGTRGGSAPAYPVIEDEVLIYPGAVVVGGIRIGRGARIGANAFVAGDVAANTTVAGVPARPVGATTQPKGAIA